MPTKVIAIVGPTASGKSALAVRLGQKFNGEVISVDSRQVYRGLDLASGKLGLKERGGIKHHLLDVANLKRPPAGGFTVAEYKKLAEKAMAEIARRGRLPIFCGGTGLYLDAVLGQVKIPAVPPNPVLRAKLEKLSTAELFAKLEISNPKRAKNIDAKNRRRLIRAIEVAKFKGNPLGGLKGCPWPTFGDPKDYPCHPYDCLKIGILVEKEELQTAIKKRLQFRLKAGLIAEIKKLHASGISWRHLDELGLECRFVSRYLRGLIDQATMIERIETESWHYAKRQMTWFKRNQNIVWIKTRTEAEKLARDFLKKSDKVE